MTPKEKKRLQGVLTIIAHNDYEKGLNARAFFKLSNHETGEDLVQHTFMKTWIYLVKGGKIEIMKAFLYHILNNLIVDEYRKHILLMCLQKKVSSQVPELPSPFSMYSTAKRLSC